MAIGAPLITGCTTAPVVTESSSKAIAQIRARCAADPACTVTSVEDHGQFWWVTTHRELPPNSPGGDSDTFVVNKRLDRITQIRVSQ